MELQESHRATAQSSVFDWGKGVGMRKDGSDIVFSILQKAAHCLTYKRDQLTQFLLILSLIPSFVALEIIIIAIHSHPQTRPHS